MIIEATYSHVLYVMRHMRDCDRDGLRAIWGPMTDQGYANKRCADDGVKFAVMVDSRPVAVIGVEDLGGVATLWMVATERMYRHQLKIYRAVQRMIGACFEAGHTNVRAFVMEGFSPGERVLERLGFGMIRDHALGLKGEQFKEFGRSA